MADTVGLNTNYNTTLWNTNWNNNTLTNPISSNYTNSIFNPTTTDLYSNDMMMSNIDFSKLCQTTFNGTNQAETTNNTTAQNAQKPQSTQNGQNIQNYTPAQEVQTPAITTNNTVLTENSQDNMADLKNYLSDKEDAQNKTEAGNTYKKTNKYKLFGAIGGFLAPILTAGIDFIRGKGFKEAFKLKELATTCPIIALTGFGAGLLLDGLVNSTRAKKADTAKEATAKAA